MGGSGTNEDPYIISNVNDLQSIGNYCGEKYKDIYYKVSVENNILDVQNNNFEPICEMYDEAEKDKAFANVVVRGKFQEII